MTAGRDALARQNMAVTVASHCHMTPNHLPPKSQLQYMGCPPLFSNRYLGQWRLGSTRPWGDVDLQISLAFSTLRRSVIGDWKKASMICTIKMLGSPRHGECDIMRQSPNGGNTGSCTQQIQKLGKAGLFSTSLEASLPALLCMGQKMSCRWFCRLLPKQFRSFFTTKPSVKMCETVAWQRLGLSREIPHETSLPIFPLLGAGAPMELIGYTWPSRRRRISESRKLSVCFFRLEDELVTWVPPSWKQ